MSTTRFILYGFVVAAPALAPATVAIVVIFSSVVPNNIPFIHAFIHSEFWL